MATETVQEKKIFVGEQNEAERKDYEADFDTFDEEDRPRKLRTTNFVIYIFEIKNGILYKQNDKLLLFVFTK